MEPVIDFVGYNANKISTIVDKLSTLSMFTGYNANKISTIVDLKGSI